MRHFFRHCADVNPELIFPLLVTPEEMPARLDDRAAKAHISTRTTQLQHKAIAGETL